MEGFTLRDSDGASKNPEEPMQKSASSMAHDLFVRTMVEPRSLSSSQRPQEQFAERPIATFKYPFETPAGYLERQSSLQQTPLRLSSTSAERISGGAGAVTFATAGFALGALAGHRSKVVAPVAAGGIGYYLSRSETPLEQLAITSAMAFVSHNSRIAGPFVLGTFMAFGAAYTGRDLATRGMRFAKESLQR